MSLDKGAIMTATPPQADAGDPLAIYEQLAAKFLAEQGEVAHRDNCEHQLDQFSDAALADALVTARAGGAASSTSGGWSRRSGGCVSSE